MIKYISPKYLGVLIFFIFLCFNLSGQTDSTKVYKENSFPDSVVSKNDLFKLSLEELMSLNLIMNTGTFLELDLKSLPYSATIITKGDIATSGARHLSELLEIYVPGFQYMYNKWNGIVWGMRGVAADRNTKFIFLVNGHKMNHESRDGAFSELSLGLLNDIERVEVIRGPSGLTYGSGAIAGVINVVTKDFKGKDHNEFNFSAHTWKMRTGGGSGEVFVDKAFSDEKGNINFSMGFMSSQGTGAEQSRIYGKASWPYPYWRNDIPQNGVPATGSAWSTDKNFRLSSKLNYGRFSFYTRATHQEFNASGFFPVDGWPDYTGDLDSTATPRNIDGELKDPESFYGSIRPNNTNRRQYVVDNIMNQLIYKQPVANNDLRIELATDLVANRVLLDDLDAYHQNFQSERALETIEVFGENRFTTDVRYTVKTLRRLNFVTGYQFRIFDIGNGIAGENRFEENKYIPVVRPVTYYNHALYNEGRYSILYNLFLHFGARYEIHTRTKNTGGFLSPLLGLNYTFQGDHAVSLTYRASANNGSADNYEYNKNNYDSKGNIIEEEYVYVWPNVTPDPASIIIAPVSEKDLHSLKPEKARSYELSSLHEFNKKWYATTSLSYNVIEDLFVWNQTLFRHVNGGEYDFWNLDLVTRYAGEKIQLGINHNFQRVVNTNMDYLLKTERPVFNGYDSTVNANGSVTYTPRILENASGGDSTKTEELYPVSDGVTVDGNNFVNLASNTTKLFIDLKPVPYLTFHSDVRIFWGLQGRRDIHEANPKFPDLDIHSNAIVKWNMSFHCQPNEKMHIGFYIYDVLGSKNSPIHTLRWQQRATAEQTDLYSVDLRSFAIKLDYTF